jgi:hypothetical protein
MLMVDVQDWFLGTVLQLSPMIRVTRLTEVSIYVDPLNPPDSSFSHILPRELTRLKFPNPFDPPLPLLYRRLIFQCAKQVKSRETEEGNSDSTISSILQQLRMADLLESLS